MLDDLEWVPQYRQPKGQLLWFPSRVPQSLPGAPDESTKIGRALWAHDSRKAPQPRVPASQGRSTLMFGFAMSGLQEFLFNLSPQAPSREQRSDTGGRDRDAARRLRIRSAILTLIPGLVAWELKRADTQSEIIYLGGGRLLASATSEAIDKLEPTLVDLYHWLVARSDGRLCTYWLHTMNAESGSGPVQELLERLVEAKWRAGRPGGQWHGLAGQIGHRAISGSLGDRDWEAQNGAVFAREETWKGFQVGSGGWAIGPWRVGPVKEGPDIALAGKAQADIEVSIPTYTPKKGGETIPLYALAEADADGKERGGAYLALLKLDGDGIGKLMGNALKEDSDCTAYREFSGKLTEFFGAGLQGFLKETYPRLYLVYSGGDDLVATGYFMDVLKAARDAQRRFADSGIPSTVSGGVAFYSRQSSILKAIEAADHELDNAKHTKDAISVAGCRLSWSDLTKSINEIEGLCEALERDSINRGALNVLRQLGEPWLSGAPEAEHELRFRSIPQMRYTRSRRTGWRDSDWPDPVKKLLDSLQTDETDWPRAALLGTLAAWGTKKRSEDE